MSRMLGGLLISGLILWGLSVDGPLLLRATATPCLKGIIRENAAGGKPMTRAPITADGANPTESDSFGQFTLEFPKKRVGEFVQVLVSKEPYVVVNDVQLEVSLPADADANKLVIILSLLEFREENTASYYRLKSFEAIEAEYDKKLKAMQVAHQTDATAIANLQKERDQAKANAEKASAELAKNQPGQDSELYKHAKRLFLDGRVQEAIDLLDDERITQEKNEAKEKAVENAVQAWLLEARLQTERLAFDKAEKAYQSAIDNAPENYEANFAYGLFSQQLHRFENARTAYQRCLGWARKAGKNSEVASTLNNLGNLDRDQGHVGEARKEYAEALQIRRELAQNDPENYRSDVADTLTNLGFLDSDQGHVGEARKECIEALQIYEELANKNAERYSVDVVRVKKRVEDLPK